MFKMEDISIPQSDNQDIDLLTLGSEDFLHVVGSDLNLSSYLISDQHTEETVDVAELKCTPLVNLPISPRGPPERKNDSKKCNFSVEIDGAHTQRKKFLYSHLLNRIYVEMGCNFSVNFNWDVTKVPNRAMYIRATVVFSDPDQAEKRVERCFQHSHVSSNAETTQQVIVNNVLRSARDMNDPNVFYCGNPNESDCWYSVVVLLNGPTGHAYHFVCKNSCSSGINRRPIDIIFTLEDSSGYVYGRQNVGTRVCSCPRRDKKQQEEEFQAAGGKRPMQAKEKPSKKIKLEVVDTVENAIVTIPEFQMVGARSALTTMKLAYNLLDQLRASNQLQMQPVDDIDTCAANIKKIITQIEREYKISVL